MKKIISRFQRSEDGAVTVDWVVLTAAVMLLGVVVGSVINTNVETATENVGESLLANTTSEE